MHPWCDNYKSLFVKGTYHFSPIEIRHLTNQIAEIVSNKQHCRSYVDLLQPINVSIPISQPPFPTIDLIVPHPTDLKNKQQKHFCKLHPEENRNRRRKKRLNPNDELKPT
ncbi:unnamed protein product [Rotaria sp. Silwood2]|nr:unnamed protein product [Rotaria sp. Silwood2]CAF2847117.1 unnamed protein product [Rotaria sp. Silwood2]CAF3049349.1 unnamed protein product [Rotaria sp. Silwood2]CAF3210125.1 unnamed protein product [Rotaria sp. Silwood2]CAF4059091.1 unnamed protein product [Rotaria sp. Silwood2]